MYKKISDKIVKITDCGETILVETEETDPKTGESIMEEKYYPLYIKTEEKPTTEFTANLTHDLNRIKQELDDKIIEYNNLLEKIKEVQTDIAEISITTATSISLK